MQRSICHLEWIDPSEDSSRFPTIECANCGASVSASVEVIDLNVPECKRLMRDFTRVGVVARFE
jgi:hypothetical protein